MPKKAYIRDYTIAFAKADIEKMLGMMTDDALRTLVGDSDYQRNDSRVTHGSASA